MATVRLTQTEINHILERIRQNEEMLAVLIRQMFRQVLQQLRSRQYWIDQEFRPRANAH